MTQQPGLHWTPQLESWAAQLMHAIEHYYWHYPAWVSTCAICSKVYVLHVLTKSFGFPYGVCPRGSAQTLRHQDNNEKDNKHNKGTRGLNLVGSPWAAQIGGFLAHFFLLSLEIGREGEVGMRWGERKGGALTAGNCFLPTCCLMCPLGVVNLKESFSLLKKLI